MQVGAVNLVVICLLLGYLVWIFRARARSAERAASGMLNSPLYWIAMVLSVTLVALTIYLAHVHERLGIGWWSLIAAIVIALLLLRRALTWRYPYR